MKIILLAPIEETVPPAAYGGIERVIHLIDLELTARGHQVILLASGGSTACNRLVPLSAEPLGRPGSEQELKSFGIRKDQAAIKASTVIAEERPDIVLNHAWRAIDHIAAFTALTTVHFPLDTEPYRSIFLTRKQATYVAISNAQRLGADGMMFAGTVYNGIDLESFQYTAKKGSYLAFLGRMSPEKGLDIAIRVAQRAGIPLKIAAKLDVTHHSWFQEVINPLIQLGGVELIGEITGHQKNDFLGGAIALLHPSRWSEPFGLAAVEAMACGTPVLALNRGAAAEIVQHGHSGFLSDDEAGLVSAIQKVEQIHRSACRSYASLKFGSQQMAMGYERLAFELCSRE